MPIPTIPSLANLPLILAGPIVRRVTRTRVAVWVATRLPATVTLTIVNSTPAATATGQTTQIGTQLHVALLDADASGAALGESTVYFYNLSFSGTGGPTGDLRTAGIVSPPGVTPAATILSYPSNTGAATAGLPSFALPQADLSRLRICQGSCRKAHADSVDMMSVLDDDISSAFSNLTDTSNAIRVQQLFLTGDQIYADDVAAT